MKTISFFKKSNQIALLAFFCLVFLFGFNSNSENKDEVSTVSDDKIFNDVNAIYVSGNDVYAVGSMCSGTSETDVPTLWKNGVAQKIGSMGNFNRATSIFVSEKDIYVTISEQDSSKVYLWKDGDKQILPIKEANRIVATDENAYISTFATKTVLWKNGERQHLGDFSANYVFVDGNDVYLAGSKNDSVAIWKNGKVESLGKKGFSNSIIVRDGDVYVLGNEIQMTQVKINGSLHSVDMTYPCLWKNGELTRLSYRGGEAKALFVSPKGDILAVGALEGKAFLWKNGELLNLEKAESMSSAYSVTQTSDGRVFVGGHAHDEQSTKCSGSAVAWVDGKYVFLNDMFQEAKIFSNDNTVYIGGSSCRGSLWAVWKYDGKKEFSPTNLIRLIGLGG